MPLPWDEYRHRAEGFRPFYRPELVLFAERHGRPIGFDLTLPDVNEALAPLRGSGAVKVVLHPGPEAP